MGGLEDRADLGIAQQPPPLALDLAQREQVLHGQGVGPHVGAVLGRHHADQRVGEEIDQLQRALAGQGIEREVAEAPLAQGPDGLVEGEAAREPDAHAVAGDLLEVGGGRRAQLGLEIAPAAAHDHDGLAQSEGLGQRRLQRLGAGQIELDPHEPLVHGPLEQPRHGGRRHAQRLGDVLLAAGLPVVELQALHQQAQLARGRVRN